MSSLQIEQIIDLDKYPLDAVDARRAELVGRVKRALAEQGACTLPGFVRADALQRMAKEAESLVHLAYPGPAEATPYFFDYDLARDHDLPADHPLRRTTRRNLSQVAADLIPSEHLLSTLHRCALMISFLSSVRGRPVYRNQDPYQCLNISVMNAGGCQQWHFDVGDMVTTLLLQAPEGGGIFEYVAGVRSEGDENFDRVKRILEGDRSGIRQIKPRAGGLTLFKGHYSIHRVTEVTGGRLRLQAILGYTVRPGLRGSLKSSILHYGPRVAELEGRLLFGAE